jgi:DNA-binding GntR family transcriptional regulator
MPYAAETRGKMLTLKEHAYRLLRQRLEGGAVRAGCRLSDDALAKEIGISRGPIREAISQLTSEGLVEHRPRRGVFVREPSRREIEELYEVRFALESFAAAKAAMIASKEQIAELQRLHQKALATVQDCRSMPNQVADNELTNRFLAADMQFHLHIIHAAGNQRLFDMVEDCKILIRVFAHVPVEHDLRLMADSTQQHASIIEAICRHDSHAARDLMMSHIVTASKFILDEYNGKAGGKL